MFVKDLYKFVESVFKYYGVPRKDAKICADVLILAERMGIKTHGLARFNYYLKRLQDKIQSPITKCDVKINKATAILNANHGMGQVSAYKSTKLAIKLSKKYGIGCVATRNSSHYGIAGYYALMCAKKNCIGISITNTRPAVSPTNGIEPLLGTNPVAIATPAITHPFLIDCATSVIQRGNLESNIPINNLLDALSYKATPNSTAEALKMLEIGELALKPIGEHKGYGISTGIEILSSCLQGGPFLSGLLGFYENGMHKPYKIGHLFVSINIKHFINVEIFKNNVEVLRNELRNSAKDVEGKDVMVAGDKEFKQKKANKKEIWIDDEMWGVFKEISEKTGIKLDLGKV